jgi:hypothetical protein
VPPQRPGGPAAVEAETKDHQVHAHAAVRSLLSTPDQGCRWLNTLPGTSTSQDNEPVTKIGTGDGHCCFVTAGAGGLIDPGWCTRQFAGTLRQLPTDLTEDDVTRPEFLLFQRGPIEIYFVPFDAARPHAKVMIVGLTPGRRQMHLALTTAATALRAGRSVEEAIHEAKRTGGFAGSMRTNLIVMLDGIGLHAALGLTTCGQLYTDRADLASNTSAICHAVFVRGRNYSGTPGIDKEPILTAFARQVLAANVAMTPDAMLIPLGRQAERAIDLAGADPLRVLRGFPHPSGANGHRLRQYQQHRDELTTTVHRWFADTCK